VVLLAVKPQDLDALVRQIAPGLTCRHVVISIAAGKTLSHLQKLAGRKVRLVRVMPNLAMMVGEGMSAFCLGRGARPSDRRLAARLLGCCGRVVELAERHFDAVTALSGSGPAFFACLMSAMADAAVAEKLPADAARLLAVQTMLGAARYLRETGIEPAAFVQAVASPKGTTAAGLSVMEDSPVREILARTIHAAAVRSRELRRG
jgi:pyrroline-5-carboxylate reductase